MKELFNDFIKLSGLTRIKFADKVGITRRTVYNIINNKDYFSEKAKGQILWHMKEILEELRNKETSKYDNMIKIIDKLGEQTNEKKN